MYSGAFSVCSGGVTADTAVDCQARPQPNNTPRHTYMQEPVLQWRMQEAALQRRMQELALQRHIHGALSLSLSVSLACGRYDGAHQHDQGGAKELLYEFIT